MPGKFDMPMDFAQLRPELQINIAREVRNKLINDIASKTDAILRKAMDEALAKGCGLAMKQEMVQRPVNPMWRSETYANFDVVVRVALTDCHPGEGWGYASYDMLRDLQEKEHAAQKELARRSDNRAAEAGQTDGVSKGA